MARLPIVKLLMFDAARSEYDDETGVERLFYADLQLREYRAVDNAPFPTFNTVKEADVGASMEEIVEKYEVPLEQVIDIQFDALRKNDFAVARAIAAARPVNRCPKCYGSDVDRHHHSGTWTAPECDYWQCEDCEHEWGHE